MTQSTTKEISMFFSPSTGGFYHPDIHSAIPEDAVEISLEQHAELMEGQGEGKTIMPPDQAHPLPWLAGPALLSLEESRAGAKLHLREKRKKMEYSGFMLNGQHWDSAEKDELRLNSVSKIFEIGIAEYEGWKIAEGVYITLTPEILQQASFALMQHYGRCFAVEAAKLAELEELDTPEEVAEWLETSLNQGW